MLRYKLVVFMFLSTLIFPQENYLAKLIADKNGQIIYEENSWLIHPLASVTKLMTGLIVIEEIQKGRFSLDDMVFISQDAARVGGSRIELYWGSRVRLKDLLYASLIHSANNATYAMAEYIGGNVDTFVRMMNQKAQELGMVDARFHTPTGLPPDMTGRSEDIGTVNDILKLSSYALQNKDLMDIVGLSSAYIDNSREEFRIFNRNKLLNTVHGVTGLKTGFHNGAGYNMTLSFMNNDNEYIVVLFGADTEDTRYNELKYTVLNFDRDKYELKYAKVIQKEQERKLEVSRYVINSLFTTLYEVNRGLVANKPKLMKNVDNPMESTEKTDKNIADPDNIESNVKKEKKENHSNDSINKTTEIKDEVIVIKGDISKLVDKKKIEKNKMDYIFIDTGIKAGEGRSYNPNDYSIRIIGD